MGKVSPIEQSYDWLKNIQGFFTQFSIARNISGFDREVGAGKKYQISESTNHWQNISSTDFYGKRFRKKSEK